MCITKIISFPEFINTYINLGYHIIEEYANNFSKAITKYEVEKISLLGKPKLVIRGIRNDDYDIVNFLELYIALSSLDSKYACIYEDELGIAKSSTNELFCLEYNQTNYVVSIEEFEDGTLIFETV